MLGADVATRPARATAPWPGGHRTAFLVGAFLLTRVACVAVIAGAAAARHRSLSEALIRFDGTWYASIAAHGYPVTLPAGPHGVGVNPTAFFPLFPSVVGAVTRLGLPFVAAALVVTTISGAVACVLIDAVVRRYADDRVALGTALLWAAQPAAFVLSMSYAESLYILFVAGCLLALLTERWWQAGILAACATATRPAGLLLVLAVLVAVVLAARSRGRLVPASLAALALAPAGAIAYVGYLGVHTGRLDAWWRTEHDGWQVYLDGGRANLQRIGHYLLHPGERPAAVGVAFAIPVLVLLAALMVRQRPPAVVATFALLTLGVALLTRNAYSSIPRFVLPAFPLLVPIATGLARRPPWLTAAVLIISTTVMAAFGAYVTLGSSYPP